MRPFVAPGSIVRTIWGDADTILFVFAGSAAEFALNRAVDWLFYTGKLPADPLGRLFSTAGFAQDIAFVDEATARRSLDRIRAAHEAVERSRGQAIPAWAHRDVLYMLIDYSERAFELLRRPLTGPERADLYDVFRRVGEGLAIPELPETYDAWRERPSASHGAGPGPLRPDGGTLRAVSPPPRMVAVRDPAPGAERPGAGPRASAAGPGALPPAAARLEGLRGHGRRRPPPARPPPPHAACDLAPYPAARPCGLSRPRLTRTRRCVTRPPVPGPPCASHGSGQHPPLHLPPDPHLCLHGSSSRPARLKVMSLGHPRGALACPA